MLESDGFHRVPSLSDVWFAFPPLRSFHPQLAMQQDGDALLVTQLRNRNAKTPGNARRYLSPRNGRVLKKDCSGGLIGSPPTAPQIAALGQNATVPFGSARELAVLKTTGRWEEAYCQWKGIRGPEEGSLRSGKRPMPFDTVTPMRDLLPHLRAGPDRAARFGHRLDARHPCLPGKATSFWRHEDQVIRPG